MVMSRNKKRTVTGHGSIRTMITSSLHTEKERCLMVLIFTIAAQKKIVNYTIFWQIWISITGFPESTSIVAAVGAHT